MASRYRTIGPAAAKARKVLSDFERLFEEERKKQQSVTGSGLPKLKEFPPWAFNEVMDWLQALSLNRPDDSPKKKPDDAKWRFAVKERFGTAGCGPTDVLFEYNFSRHAYRCRKEVFSALTECLKKNESTTRTKLSRAVKDKMAPHNLNTKVLEAELRVAIRFLVRIGLLHENEKECPRRLRLGSSGLGGASTAGEAWNLTKERGGVWKAADGGPLFGSSGRKKQ